MDFILTKSDKTMNIGHRYETNVFK